MARAHVFFQPFRHLYTIHLRHHDVAHDDVRNLFGGRVPSLLSIGRLNDAIVIAHGVGNVLADVVVILYHEQQRAHVFAGSLRILVVGGFLHVFLVQGVGVGVVHLDGEREPGAFVRFAVNGQRSFMQFGQRFDERQSDACARGLMLSPALVVSVEDMYLVFFRDTAACIVYRDAKLPIPFGIYFEVNLALAGIFHGIRHQVVDDGGNHL